MRYVVLLLVTLSGILLQAGPAHSRRVALVIGNADYKVGPLANPVNDAVAVAEAFEKLGFDKVILKRNLGADGFRAALLEMSRATSAADLGVVYFAGHGTEVNGRNFLIPIDAKLERASDLSLEAVALESVLGQLGGARKLKLVILDACRNNLFPLAGAQRSATRGLTRVEPEDNTLVVYAAKDGTTADDGAGSRHSPFTEALLRHVATPGLEINFVFRRVRDDVVAATNSAQQPHVYGTLGGKEFYLRPPAVAAVPVPPAPAPTAQPQPNEAERSWAAVKDSTSIAALEAFIGRYRDTFYADLARVRIEELRKQRVALAVPPKKVIEPTVGALDPSRGARPLTQAEERVLKPRDSFRECSGCPEMVAIPAGSFTMGSPAHEAGRKANEGPQRTVTFARPFAIGKFEVTFAEWAVCAASGGCASNRTPKSYTGRGRHPVVDVTWTHANEYAAWLSRATGKEYRLPTEAEWEYAARGVTSADAQITAFSTGPTITRGQANYGGVFTKVVGSFPSNAFGLHDMHGNVGEWVQDCYMPSYSGAPVDGSAVVTGCPIRILRGGGVGHSSQHDHRSARRNQGKEDRYSDQGFRVARSLAAP